MFWAVALLMGLVTFGDVPFVGSGEVDAQTGCISDSELSEAIRRLSLPLSPAERTSVNKKVLAEAKRSAKCRKRVVNHFMAAMDKPNLDVTVDQATYNVWVYGSELLARSHRSTGSPSRSLEPDRRAVDQSLYRD
jgi:hypothetical protein